MGDGDQNVKEQKNSHEETQLQENLESSLSSVIKLMNMGVLFTKDIKTIKKDQKNSGDKDLNK